MSERTKRLGDKLNKAFAEIGVDAKTSAVIAVATGLLAAEVDDLESRIGSLKARPEDVKEWTGYAGVPEASESSERRERLRVYQQVHALMALAEEALNAGDRMRYESCLSEAEAEVAKGSDWRIGALLQDFKRRHSASALREDQDG